MARRQSLPHSVASQPDLPVLAELLDIVGGDDVEGGVDELGLGVAVEMELVDDHLDGLLAPAEVGLADEDLDLALADVLEGQGEGVHGDDLGVLVDAVEGVVGVEGPAADEGPAGDVGVTTSKVA